MMSKQFNYESIDDVKPLISPNLLSYLQIVAFIVCALIVVCMLYIPSRPWSRGIVVVIAIFFLVILIAKYVATVNDSKYADDSIEYIKATYQDSQATQQLIAADYETLEARGREQLILEQEVREQKAREQQERLAKEQQAKLEKQRKQQTKARPRRQ